jgi:hypothetical protein
VEARKRRSRRAGDAAVGEADAVEDAVEVVEVRESVGFYVDAMPV